MMSKTQFKYIGCLALVVILFFIVTLPVKALTCRYLNNHRICIIDIKRSAKYHWQYTAVVSVDGVKKPTQVYNCRDRLQIREDGTTAPFALDGVGELICSLLEK